MEALRSVGQDDANNMRTPSTAQPVDVWNKLLKILAGTDLLQSEDRHSVARLKIIRLAADVVRRFALGPAVAAESCFALGPGFRIDCDLAF